MIEEWKDIPNYEGLYKISNFGKIKSYPKVYYCGQNKSTKRILEEKELKPDRPKGYKRFSLYNGKDKKRFQLHRLVAEIFLSNPENKPEIDHIDGNPANNRVDNLRWCTHEENLNNPITIHRKSESAKGNHMLGRKGILHHNSKKVMCVETGNIYFGVAEAERQTGYKHISCCCTGRRNTSGGYHWQYV